jgi:hypothetical protein
LSREILYEWSKYSLKERVNVLRDKFNIHISAPTLLSFYKRNGISYTKPEMFYGSELGRELQLKQEREAFALRLGKIIVSGQPLIYIDETSFNSWVKQKKVWQ